jgi:hypothetical protein
MIFFNHIILSASIQQAFTGHHRDSGIRSKNHLMRFLFIAGSKSNFLPIYKEGFSRAKPVGAEKNIFVRQMAALHGLRYRNGSLQLIVDSGDSICIGPGHGHIGLNSLPLNPMSAPADVRCHRKSESIIHSKMER